MLTKSTSFLVLFSLATAGSLGFMVGRVTSSSEEWFGSSISTEPNQLGSASASGDTELIGADGARKSLGFDSQDQSGGWYNITGPFTADAWMKIRLAALSAPIEQVEQTLARLAQFPASEERFRLEREVLAQWATVDPQAALRYAREITQDGHRRDATEAILRVWAGKEPKKAFAWLEDQRGTIDAEEYNRLFDDALRGYADLSLVDAIEYFGTTSESLDSRQTRRAISQLVQSLIQQGLVTDAEAYLSMLPEGELQERASRELISELAEVDVAKALQVLSSFEGTENFGSMQQAFVDEWSRDDPSAAAAYVSENAEGSSEFSRMASQIVRRWDDITAASDWLAQYEPSSALDRPTMMLVYRSHNEDPEGAISWATSMTNDQMRNRVLSAVASNWKHNDEAGLNAFLSQSATLTETQKQLMQDAPARAMRRFRR
ncbi:MAG: hypothetical protein AAF558_01405 [Verrucomicrobiota bacterium]